MVSMNDAFPSKYLKAADLQGHEVQVVIAGAEIEEINPKERKLVLYFRGKDKGMVCNRTNATRIAYSYGEDTDNWLNRPIVLFGEVVDFQGKATLGLRVRVPAAAIAPTAAMTAAVAQAPVHPNAPGADLSDEVPF